MSSSVASVRQASSRHPAGLWVLFTTELWERFAFYTMRAILVLYLVSISMGETQGFGWTEADAYKLYGWYTGLVYLSPLLGGWIADRFIGQRMCVIIGAVLMALGEFVLAAAEFVRIGNVDVGLATDPVAMWTFYAGLGLMILGNGFFKPCISVMVGQLYAPGDDRKRDAGFTIFYMGINIGAFMSPLVGGTVAEIYGYQYGFIIAGCGMLLGLVSFLMFGKHLKGIGEPPAKRDICETERTPEEQKAHETALYEQTRPLVKKDYDRMFVIGVLSIFVIAFWIAFEQAGSSLNIFAKANTNREINEKVQPFMPTNVLLKNEDFVEYRGLVDKVQILQRQMERPDDEDIEPPTFAERLDRFNIFRKTRTRQEVQDDMESQIAELKEIAGNLRRILRSSNYPIIQEAIKKLNQAVAEDDAAIVERLIDRLNGIADAAKGNSMGGNSIGETIERIKNEINSIDDKALAAEKIREELRQPKLASILQYLHASEEYEEYTVEIDRQIASHENRRARILRAITTLIEEEQGNRGSEIQAALLAMDSAERRFDARYVSGQDVLTFPATWYQSVNPICVVVFAPLFMILWGILARFGIEPSTPTKFALGLFLVSASFVVMIPGAIDAKLTGGKAMLYWLLLCYLLATWGELCLSPIGLSMVTKLAPIRYASIAMGCWFLASSLSYVLAGYMASYFGSGEGVSIFFGADAGLADFFLLMAVIPFVIGTVALCLSPTLKKKMHGVH